ncbi:MAG: hypothetical protein QM726_10595 [Chitinophagaceae bacterium]
MREISSKTSDPLQHLINNVSDAAIINTSLLAGGHFPSEGNQSARTVYFKGNAAVVFAFRLQKQLKALKVWPANGKAQRKKHYEAITPIINKSRLHFFASFTYIEAALNIEGEVYDALLMDWVGRQNLKEYVCANIGRYDNLEVLADKLLHLHKDLNSAGIALGHFHPGNIYVDGNNELKLIGYDAIYCDGMQLLENDTKPAYPDYTHPSGKAHTTKADYFAALILYLGIKALSCDNVLWGRCKIGYTESFIFSTTDFSNLENAATYQWMRKKKWPEIDKLLDILKRYCEVGDPDELVPFYELLEDTPQAASVEEKKQIPMPVVIEMDEVVVPVSIKTKENNDEIISEEIPAIIEIEKKITPAPNETVTHAPVVVSFREENTPDQSYNIENNDGVNSEVFILPDKHNPAINEEEQYEHTDTTIIQFWKKRKLLIAMLALLIVSVSAIVTYFISRTSVIQDNQEYVVKGKKNNDQGIDVNPATASNIPASAAAVKDTVQLADSVQLNKLANTVSAVADSTINIVSAGDSSKSLIDSSRMASAIAINNTAAHIPDADKTQSSTASNKAIIDSSLAKTATNKNGAAFNEISTSKQGNIATRKIKEQSENASFSIGAPPKE